MTTRRCLPALALAMAALVAPGRAAAQEPPRPGTVSAAELKAAIDKLGDLDYPTRMNAARTARRAAPAQAVPALIQAVTEHADGYVRFRALVLLTGFNDPRTRDMMVELLGTPNDRLRQVVYRYFEHNPDPKMTGPLLAALDKETDEFVRPALVRALAAAAANAPDPNVREVLVREVGRGKDFFRSAVIEALGDCHADYALQAITAVANGEGPLVEDAALALGKIGDKRALATLSALQRTAPPEAQPEIAAAICLLGVNCSTHVEYLDRTLRFADKTIGFQPLMRGAATGLGAVGVAGNADAVGILFDVGIPSQDPARAPIALALGAIGLRNPTLMLAVLERRSDHEPAIALLGEAFDMLEEDFEKERFFVTVRHAYWEAAEDSEARKVAGLLIQKLEF